MQIFYSHLGNWDELLKIIHDKHLKHDVIDIVYFSIWHDGFWKFWCYIVFTTVRMMIEKL